MSWMLSCIGCGGKKLVEREEAKVLDFQHYSLTSVPPYVFECERFLEELYLDFNQISELPRELFLCHELLSLSLSDNDLHSLPPAISSLSNLASLDLSKNGISDIPDNIKSCKRLRSVNASTNPLCRLPEGFTQLVALKELSLSDTFLEYLPANFGRLTGLEILELRENQLNTLPRSFTRLVALKKLDLGQNEFTELPEVVGHLASLTDLWIDNNRIKRIPPEIGKLLHLSFLDASKNRINEIDESIGSCKSLTHLYLTRNELEELPDSLCLCAKLSVVHVDDNHLDHLPDDIGRLDRVVELKVSQNEISYLPSSVGLLRSLQFLHVDDNLLSTLPGDLGSCANLIVITAAHNNITELPAEMGSLGYLRVLNLCGNSLQNLPVSFTKLQLTALWLSENQAKPSVPLQCTNDSGQKVLTCFMLPQSVTQSSPTPDRVEDDRPLTEAEIEARRARSMIHFATDGDLKPSGRLTRVPTPYPKELRALAKHTKNIMALKKEREKGSAAVAKEGKPVLKEAEKANSKENASSLVTVKKSAASVKVASNVALESAIKPSAPMKEESVPEKVVTTTPAEVKPTVSPGKDSPPITLCQNGVSPPVVPVTESPQIIGSLKSVEEKRKIEGLAADEPPFVQTSPVKASVVASVYTTTSFSSTYSQFSQPPLEWNKTAVSGSPTTSPPQLQSLRPASIAVAELGTSPDRIKSSYPLRPGSLALESSMPPWQNKRPGSLAAPINTVGIPMTSPTQRSSSQNMLYEDQRSPSFFGESWRPYQSPSQTPVKKDPFTRVLAATHEESLREQSNGEIEKIGEAAAEDALDASIHLSSVEALNEANLAHSFHDQIQQKESPSNAGLVSTINRLTEEGSDEDRAVTQKGISSPDVDRETVASKMPKIPIFAPSKTRQSPEEMPSDLQASSGIAVPNKATPLSPTGTTTSKIPHFYPPTKIAQVASPKVLSPDGTSKESVISPTVVSGIQAPSFSYSASYSKINPDKSRSGILSLASPVIKEIDFESKSRSGIPSLTSPVIKEIDFESKSRSSIPNLTSPVIKEIDFESKSRSSIPSLTSPVIKEIDFESKSRSGIPSLTSPVIKEIDYESKSHGEERYTSRIPYKFEHPTKTPQREVTPSSKEVVSPKGSSRIPAFASVSPTETKTTPPVFTRSPSQTDKESFIPIKRGDSIPIPKQALSPVEKPINQTGIPILSPNDSSGERSTRIPTSSGSSLRGRKSGVPVLGEKSLKSSGGRRLANPSS